MVARYVYVTLSNDIVRRVCCFRFHLTLNCFFSRQWIIRERALMSDKIPNEVLRERCLWAPLSPSKRSAADDDEHLTKRAPRSELPSESAPGQSPGTAMEASSLGKVLRWRRGELAVPFNEV